MISKHVVKAVLALSPLFAMQSHAAVVDCPVSFTSGATAMVENGTGTVTAASACQYLETPNNKNTAKLANINAAGFFGYTDWELNPDNLKVEANGSSGSWTISEADLAANEYMIVFKSGNGTNLIGFLLNGLYASGTWSTPFTSSAFDFGGSSKAHAVSHFTIVQRASTEAPANEVPEPGMLCLLGIGLLGFTAIRRRARNK